MKDLKLLKRYIKYQETSYNFRLGFALSNRPHFNSTYLLRVPFSSGIAVYWKEKFTKINKHAARLLGTPEYTAFKDLNLLKKYAKNQEASSILRVNFVLSK